MGPVSTDVVYARADEVKRLQPWGAGWFSDDPMVFKATAKRNWFGCCFCKQEMISRHPFYRRPTSIAR
jgi:hypothetical protein